MRLSRLHAALPLLAALAVLAVAGPAFARGSIDREVVHAACVKGFYRAGQAHCLRYAGSREVHVIVFGRSPGGDVVDGDVVDGKRSAVVEARDLNRPAASFGVRRTALSRFTGRRSGSGSRYGALRSTGTRPIHGSDVNASAVSVPGTEARLLGLGHDDLTPLAHRPPRGGASRLLPPPGPAPAPHGDRAGGPGLLRRPRSGREGAPRPGLALRPDAAPDGSILVHPRPHPGGAKPSCVGASRETVNKALADFPEPVGGSGLEPRNVTVLDVRAPRPRRAQ